MLKMCYCFFANQDITWQDMQDCPCCSDHGRLHIRNDDASEKFIGPGAMSTFNKYLAMVLLVSRGCVKSRFFSSFFHRFLGTFH